MASYIASLTKHNFKKKIYSQFYYKMSKCMIEIKSKVLTSLLSLVNIDLFDLGPAIF